MNLRLNRILAYIIDLIICYIPVCYLSIIFLTIFNNYSDESFLLLIFYWLPQYKYLMIFTYPILTIYLIISKTICFTILELCFKDTLGKKIYSIKVVDIDGNKISFKRRLLRNFLKSFSDFALIPFLITLFNEDNRTFYDKISSTKVSKK